MNLLLLSAIDGSGSTVRCEWGVTVDGVPHAVDGWPAALRLPDDAQAVTVVATPHSGSCWPSTVTLVLHEGGIPTLEDARTAPAELVSELIVGQRVSALTVSLYRLRDATAETLAALGRIPQTSALGDAGRRSRKEELASFRASPNWPPTSWDTPSSDEVRIIDIANPVVDNRIATSVQTVAPAADCVVLEIAGVKAPRLIAVCWPREIAPTPGDDPAPFLVFWRPGVGQNVADNFYSGPGLEPYPFAFDYATYGLLRYMRMRSDCFGNPYQKGVAYQVAASGRPVVSVIPCNAVGPEFGAFMDAAVQEEILLEVQRFMYRRAGVAGAQTPESLGPVAFGSFSSGTGFMSSFLGRAQNRQHRFCAESLREVYFFDPPDSLVDECVRQARQWLASPGDEAARRIRLYSRGVHAAHRTLLGRAPPKAPFVAQSDDGRFTAASLPIWSWHASGVEAGFPKLAAGSEAFQDTHQLISAVMLTHALAAGR